MPKKDKPGMKPKKPGNTSREGVYRPTESEREERLAFAIKIRTRGGHKSAMMREIADEFGITLKTAEDYLVRAKQAMMEVMQKTTQELATESYTRLLESAVDEKATRGERIRAEEAIMKLFGLPGPTKHAITDAKGNDLEPDEARTRISVLASSLIDRPRSGGSGEVSGDPGAGD